MDIVHEMNQLEMGGIERVIANLAKYDTANSHTVMAYKDGPMRAELERAGARVILAPEGCDLSWDADVLHIHCGGDRSQIAAQLGAQGFKVVETIHSPVRSPNRREHIKARVGVTKAVADYNPGAVTIYNGLDLPGMEPIEPAGWLRKHVTKSDRKIVGRIGRIGPDKCLEEFLLACRQAQESADFEVVVCGPEALAAPGYLGKVLLMADALHVRNFHYVKAMRAADFLKELDLFLYPSPTEGFGLVYAEAMAMGVPIVAWDTDAVREVVGRHAALTEHTIPDLARAVLDLLNPVAASAMTAGARERVEELFTAQRMASQYDALYREVVGPQAEKAGDDSERDVQRDPQPSGAGHSEG